MLILFDHGTPRGIARFLPGHTVTRARDPQGQEFAVVPVKALQRLMEDAKMLADVKAYDAAKARLEDGEDELIPLEITERRLKGRARAPYLA